VLSDSIVKTVWGMAIKGERRNAFKDLIGERDGMGPP
jgi:hypothetical protein